MINNLIERNIASKEQLLNFIKKTLTMLSYDLKKDNNGNLIDTEKVFLNELINLLLNDYGLCKEELEPLYKEIIYNEDTLYKRPTLKFFTKYLEVIRNRSYEEYLRLKIEQDFLKKKEEEKKKAEEKRIHLERLETDVEYKKQYEENQKRLNEIIEKINRDAKFN